MLVRMFLQSKNIQKAAKTVLREPFKKANLFALRALNAQPAHRSEELKEKPEDKKISRKNRIKTTYDANYTSALKLPCSDEVLEKKQSNQLNLLTEYKDHIIEHAARRVDLFFYTLIGYYGSGVKPQQGQTVLQHGRGRCAQNKRTITQACHSSIFSSLKDEKPQSKKPMFTRSHSDLYLAVKKQRFSGTHFMDSLNSTVELPNFVNKFDGELEDRLEVRKKSLAILQQVSMGDMNPIEGLNEFLKMMEAIFKKIEARPSFPKPKTGLISASIFSPRDVKTGTVLLTKQGTLGHKWHPETKSVVDEYIELQLRLNSDEKKTCKISEEKRTLIYENKMQEIQKEILETKSTFQRRHSL